MPLPLENIRILSLAHLYPGPFATMLLADMGADVIIVENPDGGDRTRRYDGHFAALNRNKRAVTLDLKASEGREAFLRLVESADVVLEGMRPGTMAKLGLDDATLKRRRPDLIIASLSGFGQTGPMGPRAAHDLSLQGMAGMIHPTEQADGDIPLPPLVLSDIASANAAALGIVAALFQRERDDHAPRLDVAMLDSLVTWLAPHLVPEMNDMRPARLPPMDPGYGVFRLADGRCITISISAEMHHWRALCTALDLSQFADLDEETRISRRAEIQPMIRRALLAMDADTARRLLDQRGIPAAPVIAGHEVEAHPQVRARGIIAEHDGHRYVLQPVLFDGARGQVHRPAPHLGQHNAQLLQADAMPADEDS